MSAQNGIFNSLDISISLINKLLSQVDSLAREESNLQGEALVKLKNIVADMNRLYIELKTVPLSLDKTYEIIKDIITSVHKSRFQLKGAVDGLIKQTGEQLIKVTSATEAATTKILDVSDQLTAKQNDLVDKLDTLKDKGGDDLASAIEEIKNDIYSQQDDTFMILDYLQFQDITSQQLEGAFGMLVQIEEKLLIVANLLEGLDNLTFEKLQERNKAYDKDAEFSDKAETQVAIDGLFKSKTEEVKGSDDQATSQEEIDRLMSQGANNSSSTDNDEEEKKSSQEEIDRLLKGL